MKVDCVYLSLSSDHIDARGDTVGWDNDAGGGGGGGSMAFEVSYRSRE